MAGKLRGAEVLVAVGTSILFASTFFSWFSLPSAGDLAQLSPGTQLIGGGGDMSIDLNVWDLGFARWWVYASILLGVWLVIAALFAPSPNWATILGTPLVVCSLVMVICLLVRLLDAPRPYSTADIGFYIALVGALALHAGAAWGLRDDSAPDGFVRAPRPEMVEVE